MDTHLLSLAVGELGECLRANDNFLATAESCTGGLVASTLTDVPGSSEWFRGGVVAYSNDVKQGLLGVPAEVLAAEGAVSEAVVLAMAKGVLAAVGADLSVAISGVAGPGGGTPQKPVGTVWMAWVWPGGVRTRLYHFSGDRASIKGQAAMSAINGLLGVAR